MKRRVHDSHYIKAKKGTSGKQAEKKKKKEKAKKMIDISRARQLKFDETGALLLLKAGGGQTTLLL